MRFVVHYVGLLFLGLDFGVGRWGERKILKKVGLLLRINQTRSVLYIGTVVGKWDLIEVWLGFGFHVFFGWLVSVGVGRIEGGGAIDL